MDIIARTRGRNYPWLHYNLAGWSTLRSYLQSWKVDMREFSDFNDGERISAKTCRCVASAIRANYRKLPGIDKAWLRGHATEWERLAKAGGAEQW